MTAAGGVDMPKFILVPDSYKGTMSSTQVCAAMERGIRRVLPDAIVDSLPVADGGEGSVDAFLSAIGGEKRSVEVCGPYFDKIESYYGVLGDGQTAVIEMAACAGLPLVYNKKDPSRTTTYGVGEMMLHAANSGCRQIIMCLGGSATNDGGCGAAAVGVRAKNR
jgi:glycerate kinase